MFPGTFTQNDIVNYNKFLNFVTNHMRVSPDWDTARCLEYIRLLSFMQKECGAKIQDNYLDGARVHRGPEPVVVEEIPAAAKAKSPRSKSK